MTVPRDTLGSRLRDARERAGITVESIAQATKINRSLLVGLERNDVSHWPKGIFRRAFIREYAKAIGLPAERVVSEFVQAFPEDDQPAERYPVAHDSELRLTLAAEPRQHGTLALVAMLDLCLVLLAGGIAAALGAGNFWTASGLVGLVYYPLTAASLGRTLFGHWLSGGYRGRRAGRRTQGVDEPAQRLLRIVPRQAEAASAAPQPQSLRSDSAEQQRRRAASST